MKIIDKASDMEENWTKGDALKDKDGYIALIVQNDGDQYCLMDIDPRDNPVELYSTNDICIYENPCSSLEELYSNYYGKWHKVNAKLVIDR